MNNFLLWIGRGAGLVGVVISVLAVRVRVSGNH